MLPPTTHFTSMCQEFCPGGVSFPACTKGHMIRGSLSRGFLFRGLCPRVSVRGSLSGGLCYRDPVWSWVGRYAPYWNAFLLVIIVEYRCTVVKHPVHLLAPLPYMGMYPICFLQISRNLGKNPIPSQTMWFNSLVVARQNVPITFIHSETIIESGQNSVWDFSTVMRVRLERHKKPITNMHQVEVMRIHTSTNVYSFH